MIGRLFQAFTLTLLLSACAVLSCETQSSASFGRLECPDMRQYASYNRSDCAHDVDCRRKGPGVDPNMKCCPTGKSNTHLCVVPTTTFNSSVTESPTLRAKVPKEGACNLRCQNGLVCRVTDDKAQCVPPVTCAAILCTTGSTCIEQKGRDATCVPQNKPGRPNKDNSTQQCFDDASCANDQKCCAGVCRNECKTLVVNPCAVQMREVRCGFNTACVVINGSASCELRVRPGQCPNIPTSIVNCPTKPKPNSCEDDSVCASGEKCCANGCGSLVCSKAQPVCTESSCSSTAATPVCLEVTTTSQQMTSVLPKCSAPSRSIDHCDDISNVCTNQTCLMTRRCLGEPTAPDCFPAVTCSDQIQENPCNRIGCAPNHCVLVLEGGLLPSARCGNIPPVPKPGQCPTLPPGTIGACIEACTNDFGCTGDFKCCSNGCGQTCQAPANNSTSPKPGICALVLCDVGFACVGTNERDPCQAIRRPGRCQNALDVIDCPLEPRANSCEDDSVCRLGQKCCSTGCGRTACADITACQSVNQDPPTPKPGQCPTLPSGTIDTCISTCRVDTCISACQNDGSCNGTKKCCSTGCGVTCQDPAIIPPPKPGQCPTLPLGTTGTCIDACDNDDFCIGDQKCCSNGCGHTCQAPAETTKSGQCPTLPPGTIGTCVEACTNDFNCTGDSKCCSNACGHVCKVPAKATTSTKSTSTPTKSTSTPTKSTSTPAKSTSPISTTKSATTTLAPPTCVGVKCPYGQCCQEQTIFCVRAPCPQPPPSCVNCQSTSTSTPITSTPKAGKIKIL